MSESSHDIGADDPPSTPESWQKRRDRSELNRIAALKRWGRSDGVAGTAPARDAFLSGFKLEAGPEGTPAERSIRAQRLLRAHMRELALKSARARRASGKSKSTRDAVLQAEEEAK
jgi:hypothetical protein